MGEGPWERGWSHNPSLTIDVFPVKQVSSKKSLGIDIDENVNWNAHIESVCFRLN